MGPTHVIWSRFVHAKCLNTGPQVRERRFVFPVEEAAMVLHSELDISGSGNVGDVSRGEGLTKRLLTD
jgi:hypothetical protein